MTTRHTRAIRLLCSLSIPSLLVLLALAWPAAAIPLAQPRAAVTGKTAVAAGLATNIGRHRPDATASVTETTKPDDDWFGAASVQTPTQITPTRDMNVTKALLGRAEPGRQVTYQIFLSNQGNTSASNVIVTDTLPVSVTFVSAPGCTISPTIGGNQIVWDVGSVPAGGNFFFDVAALITGTAQVGDILTNVVRISTSDADVDVTDNVFTLTTPITAPGRDMRVTKFTGDPALAGEEMQYQVSVANQGSLTATNIMVTDSLPLSVTYVSHTALNFTAVVTGSTVVFTRSAMGGGAADAINIRVRITDTAQAGSVLTNVVRVSTGDVDVAPANNTFTLTRVIVTPTRDLSLVKSVAGGAPIAGTLITYQLTLFNLGTFTATNVVVTDTLPANTTFITWTGTTVSPTVIGNQAVWNLGALARNASLSILPVVKVADATPTRTLLVNTVLASTGDAETAYGNNTGVFTLTTLAYGGPDAFGYTFKDNTLPGGPSFSWIDATDGTRSYIKGDDRFDGPIPIGFLFPYYLNRYADLYLTTNGQLLFGSGNTRFTNTSIPDPTAPNNMLAALWDDLQVCGNLNQHIYYKQGGAAPNRYFVAEWANVSRLGDPTRPITFEAVIYESGVILYQYLSLTGTLNSNTIGIENSSGSAGLQYAFGQSPTPLANGRAIRFTPPPITNVYLPGVTKN